MGEAVSKLPVELRHGVAENVSGVSDWSIAGSATHKKLRKLIILKFCPMISSTLNNAEKTVAESDGMGVNTVEIGISLATVSPDISTLCNVIPCNARSSVNDTNSRGGFF